MTLLTISRPRAMRQSARRNDYNNYSGNFNQAANRLASENANLPAVNIIEEPKSYILQLAVPGYSKQDFSINIDKEILTISANLDETNSKEVYYLTKEFSKSSFSRTFTLGKTINTSNIEATYNNGVLTLILLKKEEAIEKPARTISVY